MSTIVTRTGKGSPLTNTEVDANFTNLNDDKVENLGDLGITSTAAEINKLDGFTGTKDDLNYAKDLRATGITSTEYGNLDGVTSNIQTQLNGKVDNTGDSMSGHFLPSQDASYDLGAEGYGWRNIYTNDLHLSNMKHETGNDVDGTKGDWTIQEGEEDLFLLNNRSGKKYKFTLTEV
jgi:hypothetical protein